MWKRSGCTQATIIQRFSQVGFLIVLPMVVLLTLWQAKPPEPKLANAPANVFSAERALAIIKDIAREPRPTGSKENERVRQYLITRLKSMGLTPETQSGIAYSDGAFTSVAVVTNVVVRLKGTVSHKAVLLMAHYDSVETGPGASDDGAGVATELETLRALMQGPALKNDVIFLFTDGEEPGSLGAQLFWHHHLWRDDVGVVLNFEARGASGASLMFQTSEQNGWLIKQFAQAGLHPVSNSLMGDLYRYMPNGTDLSVSNEKKVSGMNFAFGGNWPIYHTSRDRVENIDLSSLQHHGDNALNLSSKLGNTDLSQTKDTDASYFNAFGLLIHYPQSWVKWITSGIILLAVILLIRGVEQHRLSLKKIVQATFIQLCGIIIIPALVLGLWLVIEALWAGKMYAPMGGLYDNLLYEGGFVTLTVALTVVMLGRGQQRFGLLNMLSGGLLIWSLLILCVAYLLPGGSDFFSWSLLSSLLVFGCALNSRQPQTVLSHPVSMLAVTLPVVFFLTSILNLFFIFLSATINACAMALVVLALQLLLAPLSVLMAPRFWLLPGIAMLITVILFSCAFFRGQPDSDRPKGNNISYYLNADTGEAKWVSWSEVTDEYLEQFLPHPQRDMATQVLPFAFADKKLLTGNATAVPLSAAEVQLDNQQVDADGIRKIRVVVTSKRKLSRYLLQINNPNIDHITLNGFILENNSHVNPWCIEYLAPGEYPLVISLGSMRKTKLIVSEVIDGLPVIPSKMYMPRTELFIPQRFFDHSTIVSKTFEF
ncbi:M28 family peptidase [Dickeya dadantii]|uniref:M28 family peptidase n=1 Tax=Dickeya dadantii TaxID=204038 RepID=UPI00039D5D00|nr:M28 family peptidase [Dickeya dadantii]